jgi:hypothetical protein
MSSLALERPLVPRFLLAGFADGGGQLMAERRDRTRRQLITVDAAVTALGRYVVPADHATGPALGRLLADVEARASAAVEQIRGGTFPPPVADRATVALVLAGQLLLGRYHRAEAGRAATLVGQLIVSTIEGGEATGEGPGDAETEAAESPSAEPATEPQGDHPTGSHAARPPDVLLPGQPPVGRSLAPMPALARQLAARTWQLVRFPDPVLLTSDTPVVLWAPSSAGKLYQVGLGSAHEVRVPLDARHALIIARHAPAGEIVRDLGARQARALNRTVAEGAAEWMYYHPASDPLEGVELPSPTSD